MEIEKKLYSEIKDYCAINNLKIGEFVNRLLRKAFNVEKYGATPPFLKNNSAISIKENETVEDKKKTESFDHEKNIQNKIEENLSNTLPNNIETKPRKGRKLN